MNKDEVMGHIHGSIGQIGHLSNPNATDPLKNALYSSFSAVLDYCQNHPDATNADELEKGTVEVLELLTKSSEEFTAKVANLQKMAESLARDSATVAREIKQLERRLEKLEKAPGPVKEKAHATPKSN